MRLLVAAVGRIGRGPERALCDERAERLNALAPRARLGPVRVAEIDDRTRRAPDAQAAALLDAARQSDEVILLDERGAALSSRALAETLARRRDDGVREAAFLIGGADGHGAAARARADLTLSLGAMTWPHALARALLMEQLYRAATIAIGHPYHRD